MVRSSMGTETTDENGQAQWSYTGVGAGSVGFVAVYNGKESTTVTVDDYTPTVSNISLTTGKSAIIPSQSVLLTATVTDQHGQAISSGTVTFKANGTSIGTGSISSGVATLTASNLNIGSHSITAEISSTVSNTVTVNVLKLAVTLDIHGNIFSSYTDSPFVYTGNVLVDWADGTIEEYNGGQLTHTYSTVATNRTVNIYGEITEIGKSAFRNFGKIRTVTISSGVTTLNNYCFRNCDDLTSVVLPDTVTSLGSSCFAESHDLSSVTLGNGVETIGRQCFESCPSLTGITIPNSVTSIATHCFDSCTGLTEIVLEWDSTSEIVSYLSTWIDGATSFDHFLIPEGTTALYTAKNYPSNLLQEAGDTPVPDSIDFTLTAGKQILSYADVSGGNEYATLTATVYDEEEAPIEGVTVNLYNGSTLWDTLTTGSDGTVSKTYTSTGSGDIVFTAEVDGTLLTKTFDVEDCVDVITADTDQSSKFGSSIGLRNTGTSNISYDSTNKYYSVNITKGNSESFVPINSANGLDDVVIEFDGYLPINASFLGLCFYKENSNWGRLGTKWESTGSSFEYGGNTNGSYAESNISGYTPPTQTWLHHKFTITNDTVHRQVYNGSTLIYEDTRTYTGFFTSNTKYGFTALWSTHWKQYFKNIKIKPL